MKSIQKKKKPRPLALAPINVDQEPLQLELPYLELSPLETDEMPEFPEITLKPLNIELSENDIDDIPKKS